MTRRFDPDRAPCWDEQVSHAETWTVDAEQRDTVRRRVVALLVVAPLAVAVAGVVAWIWLGGA
ncbi:hypothetical protein [Phytohabitans houttuyneae]|uniref:Uncharacterized protein n=1 Tax=Phytohabitans houttuyneae TaxID=1076126 RepID=A0A6V8KBN8_9ACTN|nr:hypothetical protein [Phytohabitans houttuyneae]GFJ79559.1 hypothetical protein Phou_037390 [Phytohabitans houttuyneae]